MNNKIILAIDYGTRRVGLALGSVHPKEYATLVNNDSLIDNINRIILNEGVSLVLVGDSKRSQGEQSTLHNDIIYFSKLIQKDFPGAQIEIVDESFTSSQARLDLEQSGLSKKEIDSRVDQYSAKLILEQYLREGFQK